MIEELKMGNLPIHPVADAIQQGTLKCSTADVFSVYSNEVVQVAFVNPSNENSVKYSLWNNNTNSCVTKGTLSPGKSCSVTIPFSEELNIYRVHNDSACGRTKTTPYLTWTAVDEQH